MNRDEKIKKLAAETLKHGFNDAMKDNKGFIETTTNAAMTQFADSMSDVITNYNWLLVEDTNTVKKIGLALATALGKIPLVGGGLKALAQTCTHTYVTAIAQVYAKKGLEYSVDSEIRLSKSNKDIGLGLSHLPESYLRTEIIALGKALKTLSKAQEEINKAILKVSEYDDGGARTRNIYPADISYREAAARKVAELYYQTTLAYNHAMGCNTYILAFQITVQDFLEEIDKQHKTFLKETLEALMAEIATTVDLKERMEIQQGP